MYVKNQQQQLHNNFKSGKSIGHFIGLTEEGAIFLAAADAAFAFARALARVSERTLAKGAALEYHRDCDKSAA